MNKLLVMVVAASVTFLSFAADVNFPDADESHDLASVEAWGGAFPGAEDAATIAAGGEFIASSNVTFAGGLKFWAGANPITVDLTGADPAPRTITLGANGDLQTGTKLTLKGGVYDYQRKYTPFKENNWASNQRKDMEIVLDGAVITNVGYRTTVGYYGSTGNNKFVLRNGAVWHQPVDTQFDFHYQGAGNNELLVTTGCTFTCAGCFDWERGTSLHTKPSRVTVVGEGARYVVKGHGYVCPRSGETLTVADGAYASITGSYFFYGTDKTVGSTILFDKAAEGSGTTAFYCAGTNNVVRVKDCSVKLGSVYNSSDKGASFGNGLDAVNGTISANCIWQQGSCKFTNFLVRVSGAAGQVNFTNAGNTSELRRGTRLVFDLPLEGYEEGFVPMSFAGSISVDATTVIEIENLDAVRADIVAKGENYRIYRLALFSKDAGNIDTAVTRANARAGDKVEFSRSGNYLDVKILGANLPVLMGGSITWPSADSSVITDATEDWTDGNGDLSKTAAWQDPATLASTRLHITKGGTYVIPSDVTLAGIDFWARREPVLLDLSSNPTVKSSANFITESKVTIRGGTIDAGGNSFIPQNSWSNNRRKDLEILLDGTVVTNVGSTTQCLGYYAGGNNTMTLTNSAVYYQKDNSFFLSYESAGNNLLEISTGSRFKTVKAFHFSKGKSTKPSTVVVTGAGSSFEPGEATEMSEVPGHRLLVQDGASLKLGGWWNINSSNQRVEIDGASTARLSSPYFYGSDNIIRVKGDSTLTAGMVYMTSNSTSNGVDIIDSKATFEALTTLNTPTNQTRFVVRVEGDHPEVTIGVSGSGQGCNLLRSDGFRFRLPVEGYQFREEGRETPIITHIYTQLNAKTLLEVETNNFEAIKADMTEKRRSRRTYRLAQFCGTVEGLSQAIAGANEKAPEGVTFFKDKIGGRDSISVKLKIPCTWGSTIIVH